MSTTDPYAVEKWLVSVLRHAAAVELAIAPGQQGKWGETRSLHQGGVLIVIQQLFGEYSVLNLDQIGATPIAFEILFLTFKLLAKATICWFSNY